MAFDLESLTLAHGAHDSPDDGMCVMEAVAFLAKESFSHHPDCTSKVVAAFMRSLNDQWDDTRRQTLKQHIPALIGTATTAEDEDTRAWMATDWLVRVHTPAFLRLAGLTEHADRLANMPELRPGTAPSIKPALDAARRDAAAAWDAAWAAARDAAWAAAWDAAWAAAWAALAPTVEELQPSIHDLIDRMCAVGRVVAVA